LQSEKARRHSDPTVQPKSRQVNTDTENNPVVATKRVPPRQPSIVVTASQPTESLQSVADGHLVEAELMSEDDIRLASLHSTSTALHYSSSENDSSPRRHADASRGVHELPHPQSDIKSESFTTSRPTTPLMADNSDSYLIRDFEDDLSSDRSVSRNVTPLPTSAKPFKKSHRRSHSDNPAVAEQPTDKKSKRRSMMGSILNFLKNVCLSFSFRYAIS
jgi:hypothetical protein